MAIFNPFFMKNKLHSENAKSGTDLKYLHKRDRKKPEAITVKRNETIFARLMTFANDHDVDFYLCTREQWSILSETAELLTSSQWSQAPFTDEPIAINYDAKRLYFRWDGALPLYVSIIHELGHILASKKVPEQSTEGDFLGWEFLLMHHIKAPIEHWFATNWSYGFFDRYNYNGQSRYIEVVDDLPKSHRRSFVAHVLKEAALDPTGDPPCVRLEEETTRTKSEHEHNGIQDHPGQHSKTDSCQPQRRLREPPHEVRGEA